MKTILFCKPLFTVLFAAGLIFTSCDKRDEDRLTVQDTQDIMEEALTDSYFQDLDDMTGVVIETPSEAEYSGGRRATAITINDDRFQCEGIVVTLEPDATATPEMPKGTITVDFGSGCSDIRGNVRRGKLVFTYLGRRFQPGSQVTVVPEDYVINGIALAGTRTSSNVQSSTADAPKFNVVLKDGQATFSDGTVALRESDITWTWVRGTNRASDALVIDQSSTASGETRAGRRYSVSLIKELTYKRFCSMAVEGIKQYVLDGEKEITIDYGSGACDKSITVSVHGVSRSLTVQ